MNNHALTFRTPTHVAYIMHVGRQTETVRVLIRAGSNTHAHWVALSIAHEGKRAGNFKMDNIEIELKPFHESMEKDRLINQPPVFTYTRG